MKQKPKQKSVKPDDPEQSKRFIDAARVRFDTTAVDFLARQPGVSAG
jgi:hypothetical protein